MMPFQGLITFYRAGQMFEPSGFINKRTHAPVGGHPTGARIRNSKDDNPFMSPERALYISIGCSPMLRIQTNVHPTSPERA